MDKPKTIADIVEEAKATVAKTPPDSVSVHISTEHDMKIWMDGYDKGYKDAIEQFRKHNHRLW